MAFDEATVEHFQVSITIHEARYLAWTNMNPTVCVEVGNKKKYTRVHKSTDSPFFNEYFVFEFVSTFEEFLDQIVCISVFHAGSIFSANKLLGSVSMDIGFVWLREDHSLVRKWAPLFDKEEFFGPPSGFVKCDIILTGRGQRIELPVTQMEDEHDLEDIEKNLIVPESVLVGRQRAEYVFYIHRLELAKVPSKKCFTGLKKAFGRETAGDMHVKITFGDLQGRTETKAHPFTVWKEKITFVDVFPPLALRIKIDVCYPGGVWGTVSIDLNNISKNESGGYLPTFGPAYTHLYGTIDGKPFPKKRRENDAYVIYRGQLLWALETILPAVDEEMLGSRSVDSVSSDKTSEYYWDSENILLLGVIFGGSLWDSHLRSRPLSLELSMGIADRGEDITGKTSVPYNTSRLEKGDKIKKTDKVTQSKKEKLTRWNRGTTNEFYGTRMATTAHAFCRASRAKFDGKYPCVHLNFMWPTVLIRLYNINMLFWIANALKWEIWKIQEMNIRTEWRLNEIFHDFIRRCNKYLARVDSWVENASHSLTTLDSEILRFCALDVKLLMERAVCCSNRISTESFNSAYYQLQVFVRRLEYLAQNPQDSLPHINIWLRVKGKRYAIHQISARRVLYSDIEEERGDMCGKIASYFFQVPFRKRRSKLKENYCASFEIFLWLGYKEPYTEWITMLPPGGDDSSLLQEFSLPDKLEELSVLTYTKFMEFELHAYIYQARVLAGADASGLCDPFLKISMSSRCEISAVKYQTLNPLWNQTLILPNILLAGNSEEYYTKYPPYVYIELMDEDKWSQAELVGSVLTKVSMIFEEASSESVSRPSEHIIDNTKRESSRRPLSIYWSRKSTKPLFLSNVETYEARSDLQLQWIPVFNLTTGHTGDVLAAFALKRVSMKTSRYDKEIIPIPAFLSPTLSLYRFEVMFWGLRDFNFSICKLRKPYVLLECSGNQLRSASLPHKRKLNFPFPLQRIDMFLPENPDFRPAITLKISINKSFRRVSHLGCHVIQDLDTFMLVVTEKRTSASGRLSFMFAPENRRLSFSREIEYCPIPPEAEEDKNVKEKWINLYNVFMDKKRWEENLAYSSRHKAISKEEEIIDDTENDWWTKYYDGLKLHHKFKKYRDYPEIEDFLSARLENALIMIYSTELEDQPEFHGFVDWLHTFPIYSGKWKLSDEFHKSTVVGKFKGSLIIYKLSEETSKENPNKYFSFSYPLNDTRKIVVRVYVIKATGLHPMDFSGKSDPYVVVQIGKKKIVDKENYIPGELNPVFGRFYEMEATLPEEYMLKIRIMDWDVTSSDDLIGETTIDLENRYYSFHRGTCGLSSRFDESGYNGWRDTQKPSVILKDLCQKYKISGPRFYDNCVDVASCTFRASRGNKPDEEIMQEVVSLEALHHWQFIPVVGRHLVPEHVETRSLFNPDEPGIEKGKLQMWVDIMDPSSSLPPPVDISPRKPRSYELRCIVWTTEDVILTEDDFFLGEKVSDIYVKGWLGDPNVSQHTDVHFRSLNGEGLFNWRFIFPFEYISAEKRMVVTRSRSFSRQKVQELVPCHLHLQVWDNDRFSPDDYIGTLTLDILRIPRGAKEADVCSLRILDSTAPTINLFKAKCTRGWWPFQDVISNVSALVGKVELELEILTEEESLNKPAGKGRSEPDKLPEPSRPDTSFSFFRNPLRAFVYLLWHRQKWRYLKIIICIGVFIFIGRAIYSVPEYSVKKLIGA